MLLRSLNINRKIFLSYEKAKQFKKKIFHMLLRSLTIKRKIFFLLIFVPSQNIWTLPIDFFCRLCIYSYNVATIVKKHFVDAGWTQYQQLKLWHFGQKKNAALSS